MNTEILLRFIYFIVFVATILISAYYRRKARTEGETIQRSQEGFLVLSARILLGCTVLFFILSYPFYPDFVDWSVMTIPYWVRWTGVIFAITCPLLSFWLFRNIGSNISETVLTCLLYTSPSPRDLSTSRMPSSA